MAQKSPADDITPVTEGIIVPVDKWREIALPPILDGKISLSSWADSIINNVPYDEPDPEYLGRSLLYQTLTAETADKVFEQAGIRKLQEYVPNTPNATSGPIEIRDLYVAKSDQKDGLPTYMILDICHLDLDLTVRVSTGAGQLQAQILRLISFGQWPIRCQITRMDRKDRGDRYLFWLAPADV